MAQIVSYILDNEQVEPFKNARDIEIAIDYGTETQPSLSLDSVVFSDTKGQLSSTKLRTKWAANPVEGYKRQCNRI